MSGISEGDAGRTGAVADLVTGCASKTAGSPAGRKALLRAGAGIPILLFGPAGTERMVKRIPEADQKEFRKPARLPEICDQRTEPLV